MARLMISIIFRDKVRAKESRKLGRDWMPSVRVSSFSSLCALPSNTALPRRRKVSYIPSSSSCSRRLVTTMSTRPSNLATTHSWRLLPFYSTNLRIHIQATFSLLNSGSKPKTLAHAPAFGRPLLSTIKRYPLQTRHITRTWRRV